MHKKESLGYLVELDENEKENFYDFLQKHRSNMISSPKDTVLNTLKTGVNLMEQINKKHNISYAIEELRTKAWQYFLQEEAIFNSFILKHLSREFEVPQNALLDIVNKLELSSNRDLMRQQIESAFGDYAGKISPYIYNLSLSNTQSRRSRAGKVFEGIIYGLYDNFNYSYESQASVGSKGFKSKGLGKIVDSLLPNLEAFQQRRDKVIIGTMKTTLRERWQEVIEEMNRTALPQIYLLTVDDDISEQKIRQMANHNVVLVVYEKIKEQKHIKNHRNVISFEEYFLSEIPEKLNYWSS